MQNCYQSPQKESSLKPAGGCLKPINGGFLNQLLLAWFLEQAVSWKLLPGQAVKAKHRKSIRWTTGLQTDAGSSRKGCTPETGGLKGRNGFSNSYTAVPWSVVCPCSALRGETWGRPGVPVPLVPAAGCTLVRHPWTDIGATALGRALAAAKSSRAVKLKQQTSSEQEREEWTLCFLWRVLNHLVDVLQAITYVTKFTCLIPVKDKLLNGIS